MLWIASLRSEFAPRSGALARRGNPRVGPHSGSDCVKSGGRLALVADDPRLAAAVSSHLQKAGLEPSMYGFSEVGDSLGPYSDSLLLLAAASSDDALHVLRLVQQI